MTNIIRIALHKSTGQFIHIDNASNGLSCDCECLKCGEKLEAVQGEIRAKHFRHYTNKECEGSQETALHELGKQILVEHKQIQLPKYGLITYSEPKAEQRFEKIRPDVSAQYQEHLIYFEIFVSHSVDDKKDAYIKGKQMRCVEIDLSSNRTSSYEEIKQKVLTEIETKRIIFWPTDRTEKSTSNAEFSLGSILTFIGIVIGIGWLFRRK